MSGIARRVGITSLVLRQAQDEPWTSLTLLQGPPTSAGRERFLLGAGLAALLLVAAGAAFAFRPPPREPVQVILAPDPAQPPAEIKVYVSGAVRFPGVYSLAAGDRVERALEAAGGPGDNADVDRVNLAERLRDGSHVLVPTRGEQLPLGTAGGRKLSLNSATQAELDALPGIGTVRAQRVITSRTNDGPFREPFDLVSRGLVPLAVYQQIKDLVSAP